MENIINPIISECNKLAQKEYKTKHNWMEKKIERELCQKLRLDSATKRYMHKPESIQEIETLKIFWHFEIQTDHIIPARLSDIELIKKKKKKELTVKWIFRFQQTIKWK